MKQLRNKILVDGLLDIHFSKGIREGCVLGKNPHEKFDKGKTQRDSSLIYLIHSDLMGPFCIHQSTKIILFSFLLMISHVSRGFTFSGKNLRSFNTSKISKPLLRHSPERKSNSFELITGYEYVNNEIHNLFHEVGIQLQHTVPYTPQQNRVAEWKNRSLKETTSFMLHAKSLQ
jgi:hypothetical protein